MVYHFGMPRSWEVQKCENQNQGVPSAKVATKNSHQKPPKSPVCGISPSPLDETCWASNSVWKIGIISLIRITQSKVRPIENLLFLMISAIFKMLLKFRQLAILAVSGGYFAWLLWRTGLPDFGYHIFELPRTWAFQNGIPIVHWVFFLKWLRGHMWYF